MAVSSLRKVKRMPIGVAAKWRTSTRVPTSGTHRVEGCLKKRLHRVARGHFQEVDEVRCTENPHPVHPKKADHIVIGDLNGQFTLGADGDVSQGNIMGAESDTALASRTR
jgi:hypothetical protein